MLPSHDEVNPNIVWQLNREVDDLHDTDGFWLRKIAELEGGEPQPSRAQRAIALHQEFVEKYDRAREAALTCEQRWDKFDGEQLGQRLGRDEAFIPLAFRIDILAGGGEPLAKDDLNRDKLGGCPDLRKNVFSHATRRISDYEHRLEHYGKKDVKERYPNGRPEKLSLRECLEAIWPKCSCCGRYMRFIGQFNYSDHRNAIHLATKRKGPHKYSSDCSTMGYSRDPDRLMDDERHLFFYCPCNCFDNPDSDSVLMVKGGLEGPGAVMDRLAQLEEKHGVKDGIASRMGEHKYEPPYTEVQYKAAVTRFMKKHGIHPSQEDEDGMAGNIPLQFVEGYELNFDVDWFGTDTSEIADAVREAVQSSAGTYGSNFTLFGKADSQQTPKRYVNTFGYENAPTRKAPLLSWNDSEHDFTYQIYGDFRYHERFGPPMRCKYDGSCT